MNQPAKFVIGIGVAVAAAAALMFASGTVAFGKRKNISENDVNDEINKTKPKRAAPPPENKPLLIQGVRDLLKGTNIDAFDGVTDTQFNKLSGPELKSMAKAIDSKRNYTSESNWRQSEPAQFNTLMTLWSKTTGKKISV
jgi:hypothetical protein